MGDNLPELLYATFVANVPDIGMVPPPFARLSRKDRATWEAVAAKARNEMASRFVSDLDQARSTEFGELTIEKLGSRLDVIRARWGR